MRHCAVLAPVAAPTVASGCLEDIALAILLPLLGCGEEAATFAFDALARTAGMTVGKARLLNEIAAEERVHDALIWQLRDSLPQVEASGAMLMAARRFHIALKDGGPALHFAKIAALDSAVCVVLSRLLRRDGTITRKGPVASVLRRIWRDEARHVRVARAFALDAGATALTRDNAAATRGALANVLTLAADHFEMLGVDPVALDRDLRRLPDGLLPG